MDKNKITINMMSAATSVKGQGVGSAYLEQVALVKNGLRNDFEIHENRHMQADITHYHTINLSYALGKHHKTSKGASVGYVHMLPETLDKSISLPAPMRKIFYKYLISFYKSMDYLVTVNPYFIGELEKYGVPRERVTYIPNYVSTDVFHAVSCEEKAALREKYGIPKDKFVVLCAGQLQVRKGIFDYLKVAEAMPDVQFVWAGGFSFGAISDGYKELQKIVQDPPQNVKFLGIIEREDMNGVYNIADVMFLPSFDELFPMTILEAMCTNTPILLRDLVIYNDILFDFYYKADNVAGFVDILYKLKDDENYYANGAAMSKKGNIFYSRESVVKMWDNFYKKVYEETLAKNSYR